MLEKIWDLVKDLTEKSHHEALSKCDEMGFDKNCGIVPLEESYINLRSACDLLKDAIETKKLIQLPISFQENIAIALKNIVDYENNLIAGENEVANLSKAIEELNAGIWLYGLHNFSNEVIGYQTKLNQLKEIEVASINAQKKLQDGLTLKENLERIWDDANKRSEWLQKNATDAETAFAKADDTHAQILELKQKATESLKSIQENITESNELLETSTTSSEKILALEKKSNALALNCIN